MCPAVSCIVICSWVTQSVAELEVHSRIFDEMGFLPASPYNKINIHVGGTYGGPKEDTLRRFAQVGWKMQAAHAALEAQPYVER
jgi:UV DNA damage repair endonuclease